MKKLSLSFLLMLGLMSTIFLACKEEDEGGNPTPAITSVTPNSGAVGTQVVIAGTNFGTSPTVSFGNTSATVASGATATSITTTVPTGLAAGAVNMTVTAGGQTSAASTFTVTAAGGTGGVVGAIGDTLGKIENLTTLAAAVDAAGIKAALNAKGPFTIFAPNNAAFTALLEALELNDLPAVVNALTQEGVAQLLQAHVIPDSLGAAELTAKDYTTINDSTITITKEGNNVFVNGAQVMTADIKAGNGVIHIIDSVINLPPVTEPAPTMVAITDADLVAGQTYNWTADNEYLLTGLVYLEEGGVLNIEAGTTIRFEEDTASFGDNTSALIITKGAKINATGTAESPIVFTAEADTVNSTLLPSDNGKWGGLVILGNAPASLKGATTNIQIEGIPSTETRARYGGNVAEDNSGTLKYVSIRYTGIGFAPGDELQGLTLGGVGSGTTLDYIDIYSSGDDGIEIFGGTVNISHISVAFATDDSFDFDLGWRGTAQFLFALQGAFGQDHAGEWDGADPDDAPLFSAPLIYNATFVGPGQGVDQPIAVIMRDAFAGKFANSIIQDYPGIGIEVEDINGEIDSYARLVMPVDGFQVEILNNTWAQFGGATDVASLVRPTIVKDNADTPEDETFQGVGTEVVNELQANDNVYSAASVLTSVSRDANGGLDPRPAAQMAAVTASFPPGLQSVTYRGAFEPGQPTWIAGWSTLAQFGFLAQ